SLFGPHRDDLMLELKGLPVKGYASHGEMWSFALSLKLALADVLREDSPSGDPVLVLDDVFAELDVGRRERLILWHPLSSRSSLPLRCETTFPISTTGMSFKLRTERSSVD